MKRVAIFAAMVASSIGFALAAAVCPEAVALVAVALVAAFFTGLFWIIAGGLSK